MKLLFLCLLGFVSAAAGSKASLSPITRVVELLKGLSKQIEDDGSKEEDLYETYVCWGKSVIEEKTNSNAAANSKLDELTAYIADLESGRVELTSERANLEKDIEELMADLELAKNNRNAENKDFLEAEAEMTKAITALQSARDVLKEATKDSKKSALVAMRQSLNGGIVALAEKQAHLRDAVEFGQRFLSKGDALFLRRVLLGDVPKVDWKKLNRKATFKMSYKARSGKIQEVLAKIHQTFKTNLKDAQDKEKDSVASYEKLSKAKQGQLDTAQSALTKQESENGARGMSKQNAKDEVASLTKQVADDGKFIKDTTQALEDKKGEWKKRSTLRSAELAAISKAISILHNDDSRDVMKKSFASQGFLFLQTEQSSQATTANNAAAALRDAARRSGDDRLAVLASSLANADPSSVKNRFDPVIKAVDKMIAILKADEQKDLDTKQTCEEDRMTDTQKAITAGRAIDDMSDTITRLTSEIAELQKEMDKLQAEHDKVSDELKKAADIRKGENTNWKKTDADDEAAAQTVKTAQGVIEKFYKDNGLSLAQQAKGPGDAPKPPPSTWEGDYGGKTGESMGIVALLSMVHEDIIKDQASAKADEDKAQTEFDKFKKDSEDQMKELMSDKNARSKTKGEKGTEKSDTEKSRTTKKGALSATLEKISKANPNCEYYLVNYPLRRKNRQIEIDGLEKAKAILNGGTFNAGPDPNRDITPGDAASANFLQSGRK